MAFCHLSVVLSDERLVRIPDEQNSPPSELSDVFLPPLQSRLIECAVVSLLQDGGALTVVPGLSEVTSFDNTLVIEDGACEDPGGGLHQVPGPGVARAWVGDQGSGLEAVSHHEPGPVLGTLGV